MPRSSVVVPHRDDDVTVRPPVAAARHPVPKQEAPLDPPHLHFGNQIAHGATSDATADQRKSAPAGDVPDPTVARA